MAVARNMLTVYANQISETQITVTTTEQEKKGSQVRTYVVGIMDDRTFALPNDLNMYTANLLYSVCSKLMQEIDPSDESRPGVMSAYRK